MTRGTSAVSFGDHALGTSVLLGLPRTFAVSASCYASSSKMKKEEEVVEEEKEEEEEGEGVQGKEGGDDTKKNNNEDKDDNKIKIKNALRLLDTLTVGGHTVARAGTAEGDRIRSLLVPSQRHMDFTVAHELAHLKHRDTVYGTLLKPFSLAGGFLVGRRIVVTSKSQVAAAASCGVLAAALITAQVSARWLQELRADATAAELGPQFRLGGLESLEKRRMLNLEVRQRWIATHGTDAGCGIAASGDPNSILGLASHPPLSLRLRCLRAGVRRA